MDVPRRIRAAIVCIGWKAGSVDVEELVEGWSPERLELVLDILQITAEVRLEFDRVRHLADERGRRWECPLCDAEPTSGSFCICEGDGYLDHDETVAFYAELDVFQRKGFGDPVEITDTPAVLDCGKCCEDCAFRFDSPERDSGESWEFLERLVGSGDPFYCHKAMLTSTGGTLIPLYGLDARRPKGYPLCGGWVDARARHIREVFNRK